MAKAHPERLNEVRPKKIYPDIAGLSRHQVFNRFNPLSCNMSTKRDTEKRESLIRQLGGRCIKCGYCADIRALVLDHIHGDGSEDRLRVKTKIQRYYHDKPHEARDRLQVLCANCNMIKAINNKEHNKTRRVIPLSINAVEPEAQRILLALPPPQTHEQQP